MEINQDGLLTERRATDWGEEKNNMRQAEKKKGGFCLLKLRWHDLTLLAKPFHTRGLSSPF